MGDNNQPHSAVSGPYRRDVMKLLGTGTAAAAFGGVAAGDQHEEESSDESGDEDDVPMEGTVHVVRTLVGQSTSPQRPADFFYQPTGLHIEPGDVIKFVFETPDHTVTSYHPAFGMQRRVPAGVQPFSSPIMGWDPSSLPDDIDMPPAIQGAPSEGGETDGEGMENDHEDNGETEENWSHEETDEMAPRPSTWLYAFDTPGVYDLECAPHEGYGMAMRVVVGEETDAAFETSDADELPPPRAGPVGFARLVLTDPNLEPDAIVDAERVEWMDLEMNQAAENGEDDDESTETGDDTSTEEGA